MGDAYADAGVDYSKIQPFKDQMVRVARDTILFPNIRDVVIVEGVLQSHGGVYLYRGDQEHLWCQTTEGLGNKNWVAEWMYANSGIGKSHYDWIGWDNALMAVNDVIAQGSMPVAYTDEVAAGDSDWFEDDVRSQDLARGFYTVCHETSMALVAGESPSLRYLVNSELSVKSCPSLSGCVVGIIAPSSHLVTGENLQAGDSILGVTSSGPHCNGFSLIIKKAMELPEQFLTKVPGSKDSGLPAKERTLGAEVLHPTKSYVGLVGSLLYSGVEVHALIPGTGGGVGKLAYDKRQFTYRIGDWPEVQPIFRFFLELGVKLEDCLKTFNWGIGYYIIVPRHSVIQAIEIGIKAGYEIMEIGRVEEGERQVIFEPERITLNPQGE